MKQQTHTSVSALKFRWKPDIYMQYLYRILSAPTSTGVQQELILSHELG